MTMSGPTDTDRWDYCHQLPTMHTDLNAAGVAQMLLHHRPDGTALGMGTLSDEGYYTGYRFEVSRGEVALMDVTYDHCDDLTGKEVAK